LPEGLQLARLDHRQGDHRLVHDADVGPRCGGNRRGSALPEWRPPRWVDRDRKPLINNRIRSATAATTHRRQ
jgi:hypothetical protein